MTPSVACAVLVALIAATIAAVTDMCWFRIYNVLTFPLIASGIIYHTVLTQTAGFMHSVGGICVGGGVLLLLYVVGGTGAGDVKLMAGVGAWLGAPATFHVLIITCIIGGVYALVLLILHGGVSRTVNNLRVMCYQIRALGTHLGPEENTESLVRCGESRRLIPYGAMIAVGIVVWLFYEGVSR